MLFRSDGVGGCFYLYDGILDKDENGEGYLNEIIENNEERLIINQTNNFNNEKYSIEYTVNQNKLIMRRLDHLEGPESEFDYFSEYFFDIPCN